MATGHRFLQRCPRRPCRIPRQPSGISCNSPAPTPAPTSANCRKPCLRWSISSMRRPRAATRRWKRKVRSSLANAQYHIGWLMRLELAEKKEWMEPLDKARQNFRLLAEESAKTDAKASEDHQKNLEAVVRLARMDLSDVQALPLPKKCQGNKNVCSKCQGQKKSNKPKEHEKEGGRPRCQRRQAPRRQRLLITFRT